MVLQHIVCVNPKVQYAGINVFVGQMNGIQAVCGKSYCPPLQPVLCLCAVFFTEMLDFVNNTIFSHKVKNPSACLFG